MPPIATTAKAITMTSTPSPGVTEILGAVNAPPNAPSTAPIMKVIANTAVTLMPSAVLISRS